MEVQSRAGVTEPQQGSQGGAGGINKGDSNGTGTPADGQAVPGVRMAFVEQVAQGSRSEGSQQRDIINVNIKYNIVILFYKYF